MPRVHAAVVDERLAAQHRARRGVVLEQADGELGQVAGGAPLARVGQAVGVREPGAREAELARLRVHPLDERTFVAGEPLGERRRGVVGRRNCDAIQQDVQRDPRAGAQAHAVFRRQRGVVADLDRFLQVGLAALDVLAREVERHELDEARGRPLVVGVLRVDGPPVSVEKQDGVRRERHPPAVQAGDAPVLGDSGGGEEQGGERRKLGKQVTRMHWGYSSQQPKPPAREKPVNGPPSSVPWRA